MSKESCLQCIPVQNLTIRINKLEDNVMDLSNRVTRIEQKVDNTDSRLERLENKIDKVFWGVVVLLVTTVGALIGVIAQLANII